MNESPHDLVELARWLGRHPGGLVKWGEGIAATKNGDSMFVTPQGGFDGMRLVDLMELNPGRLLELVGSDLGWEPEIQKGLSESRLRPFDPDPPRMVFLLAYLLTLEGIKFAAHTQPVAVNQILASPRARQFADRRIMAEEILACGPAGVLVPHSDSLLELARECRRKLTLWKDRFHGVPKVILLSNNGMIALGASVHEVCLVTEMTVKAAETFVGASMLGGPVFLSPGNVTKIEGWR